MMKKFIIGIVVIIVLVVLGMIMFGEKTEAPSAENFNSENGNAVDNEAQPTNQPEGNSSNNTAVWNEFDGEIGVDTAIIQTIIVEYKDGGFSPTTLTIDKGQTVRFVNETGRSMWVASDFHPSHNIYPEFDAKRGIPAGSSYEFKFEKTGAWNYHDHLSANQTGTIIVK